MIADAQRPVTLLICALGGEGGGVLAEWLVETANRCGYASQSTSIPGVAQRTGSTTYYFEVFPVPISQLGGRRPVFSLFPVPGALDVLVSSELLETARQVGNGMASPERTLVISSDSRTLTTAEKLRLTDGRADSARLLEAVREQGRECRVFDMAAVASEAGTAPSAVLFGAIAGSGALPFSRAAFEQTIRESGKGVEASLRGFARAFDAVATGDRPAAAVPSLSPALLPPVIARRFPAATHEFIGIGHARLREYQDAAYASLYVERLERVLAAEESAGSGAPEYAVTRETARHLALWMAFDDVVRVAGLKCRASRFARVRGEVKAQPGDLVRIYDHFKPGVPEVAGLLPAGLARALQGWDKRRRRRGLRPFAIPLKLGAHTLTGFGALRLLAGMKWLRRRGARFAQEQAMIERWLGSIEAGTRENAGLGLEIALCAKLVKGYGSTNDRGRENLLHILDQVVASGKFTDSHVRARMIRAAREAALADDAGSELDKALAAQGLQPRPVQAQPIVWVRKQRSNVA